MHDCVKVITHCIPHTAQSGSYWKVVTIDSASGKTNLTEEKWWHHILKH